MSYTKARIDDDDALDTLLRAELPVKRATFDREDPSALRIEWERTPTVEQRKAAFRMFPCRTVRDAS